MNSEKPNEKSEIDENNFNKFQDEKQVGDELIKVVQQQQQSPTTTTTISENKKSRILMSSLQQKQNDDSNDAGLQSKFVDNTKKMHRRVSFPLQNLVTGYLEASNPFAEIRTWTSKELVAIYVESCKQHEATPIESVLEYLGNLEVFEALCRSAVLNLRDQQLSTSDCEALEAILKRVQFRIIDLNNCGLDDASACSLFDMIEYYEATNELDVSYNPKITIRGWQSMVSMIKKSHALNMLSVRGFPISISMAANLGQALMVSFIHTLKLEHCGLAGRPIANLCKNV
jgi:protein phosphatase 1 regulatory subunit 37